MRATIIIRDLSGADRHRAQIVEGCLDEIEAAAVAAYCGREADEEVTVEVTPPHRVHGEPPLAIGYPYAFGVHWHAGEEARALRRRAEDIIREDPSALLATLNTLGLIY